MTKAKKAKAAKAHALLTDDKGNTTPIVFISEAEYEKRKQKEQAREKAKRDKAAQEGAELLRKRKAELDRAFKAAGSCVIVDPFQPKYVNVKPKKAKPKLKRVPVNRLAPSMH